MVGLISSYRCAHRKKGVVKRWGFPTVSMVEAGQKYDIPRFSMVLVYLPWVIYKVNVDRYSSTMEHDQVMKAMRASSKTPKKANLEE